MTYEEWKMLLIMAPPSLAVCCVFTVILIGLVGDAREEIQGLRKDIREFKKERE